MAKNSKRQFLLITIFLMTLFIYSNAVLIPNVLAAEVTIQQKAFAITSNVIGLDLSKYVISQTEYPQDSFQGIAPQEHIVYSLKSNASKVKFSYTFTKGKLHILHVLERDGTPILTKSATNARDMAKDFLSSYQYLTSNSFYGKLSSTLNRVDDTKNSTATFGNAKLQITTSENSKSFVWSYTHHGIDASCKCVSLMYKDGFLKYFVATWDLYPTGSTRVNLSEEEAITIAMEQAKAYSWKVGLGNYTVEINNFNVTKAMETRLLFCNSINAENARGEDRLTLHPMWRIGVGLDKYYPGDVYGIYVDIWADTGEIRSVNAIVSPIPPPEDALATIEESTTKSLNNQSSADMIGQNSPINWVPLLALFTVLSITGQVMLRKKEDLSKRRFLKIIGALLCFLILFSALLLSVNIASATGLRRATIWGSLAQVKMQSEIDKQDSLCDYISGLFDANGYVTTDYQGSSTVKDTVLDAIEDDEQDYQYVATVWFDHGIGHQWCFPGYPNEWHYRLCDSTSVPKPPSPYAEEYPDPENPGLYNWQTRYIYDFEIYYATGRPGKTFFAFISTCMSGKLDLINPLTGNPLGTGTYGLNPYGSHMIIGMPYAWTHGASLSLNGYDYPDSGEYCYIGFPWGSPALNQAVDPDLPYELYYYWVTWFFIYALNPDYSVNQALDQASLHEFNQLFGQTDLRNNFYAYWEGSGEMDNCRMAVYGNGNIRLKYYNPSVDSVGRPTTFGPINGVPYETYYFTTCAADSQGHDIRYKFDWGDDTYTMTDYYPSGEEVTASHSWSSAGEKSVRVSAQCDHGVWSTGMSYNTIYIGDWYWLYLQAYEIDYWSTVATPFYVDDEYISSGWGQVYLQEGYHTIEVDDMVLWENGYVYLIGFGGFGYQENPIQIYLDYNREIIAYYTYG